MKKLLTLIAVLFISAPTYAQETINANVKKDDSYSDAVKARAAVTAAAAKTAAAETLANGYKSNSKIPISINQHSEKQEEALALINSVRNQATLEPLFLSKRLSDLASSRLDSVNINGGYVESLDDTGEIYFRTEKDFENHYYNAVIGLIIPGKNNFTYDQITCDACEEIGFASKTISSTVWTMLVFDSLY